MNTSLILKAVLSGIFFGVWPLLMNKSGLSGNMGSAVFVLVSCLLVVPFASVEVIKSGLPTETAWFMAVCAGLTAGIGLLVFNDGLAQITPQVVGIFFVLMIVIQTMVPVVYQVIVNGQISLVKGMGLVLAVVSAIMLTC